MTNAMSEPATALYAVLRRSGWRSHQELRASLHRSGRVIDEQLLDDLRWIRSYVLSEDRGEAGTLCIVQATSPEAIRRHASLAELPVDEIVAIADTVLVAGDPLGGTVLNLREGGVLMHHHTDKPASFHSSPREAIHASPEEFLYIACLYEGTGVEKPDFIAVVDAEEGRIVHELPMPNVGDELHHYGWNRCSWACHGPDRSHLIVPGFRSSRIHIINVADDPRRPWIEKVIERDELVEKTGYTRPHTVHCMPGENIVISMLGDANGHGVGGFAVLDAQTFEIKGRWENGGAHPSLNYDFWYQPRKNTLVSSEFGEPNAYEKGFDPADVQAGRYGRRIHFWTLADRTLEQTVDLGENGLVPLEVRWLHDPDAEQGFVGAALSSTVFHFHRQNGGWAADQVIAVDGVPQEGWPFPVPGLITDIVLSMDDRFLYLSNWLHGDLRQYDVSDPTQPKLTGQLQLGGVLGRPVDGSRELNGGPQMIQLSYDGRRLYVTNSLYSTWDNQFYPGLRSWLMGINCHPDGGMEIDEGFFLDFHDRPDGPARAHEVRLQGGDCTTEIFQ